MGRIDITLNPLFLFNLEFAEHEKIDLSASDNLLHDLGWDSNARTLKDLKARYKELRAINVDFHMAPAEKWIQSKVIAPLRQAMANYVLSNYLSTIALCGMAAEMTAMLLYDMMLVLKDTLSKADKQRLVDFKHFQRKGQQARVDHLVALECVGLQIKEPFEAILKIRRKYLHFYLQDLARLKDDAFECYKASFLLVRSILAHRLTAKGINLPQHLLEYLKRKGVAR